MIKLGGNIVLEGCDDLEPATLIVLKKMVGNYARKISDKNAFDELNIKLEPSDGKCKISASIIRTGSQDKRESENVNMFFALNDALKDLV